MLIILYALYLLLLLVTDLVPTNQWNSIWIVAILTFCTGACALNTPTHHCVLTSWVFLLSAVAFYQISERYSNAAKLRTGSSGQVPFIPMTCRATEVAVTSIFARAKSAVVGAGGEAGGVGTAMLAGNGMKFSLRQ